MKKLYPVLVCCLLAFASPLRAQISGVTITPVGATGEDTITITVDPAIPCPDLGPGLAGVPLIRLHAGITAGGAPWQNVVNGGPGTHNNITGFTQLPNGKWMKKLVPRSYVNAFSDQHIEQLCFVLNGGPDTSPWDNQGKRTDSATGSCIDFFVSFPLSGPITGHSGLHTSATATSALNLCDGDSAQLVATGPAGAQFAWYKNWVLIPGATGPTLTAHESATYLALTTLADSSWLTNRIAINIAQPVSAPRVDSIPHPICAGTSATLVATNANQFRWYGSATSQTVLDTTDTFHTPALSGATTYFVSSHLGFCDGPRLAITVPVKPYPARAQASGDTVCAGAVVALSASGGPAGSTYAWYADTLAAAVHVGPHFSPGVTQNATYYLIATDSGCKSLARPVHVAFLAAPAAPAVSGPVISCPFAAVHLQASNGGGGMQYRWYADSTSQNPLYSGDAVLLYPDTIRTLWVAAQNGACVGPRARFVVEVYARPLWRIPRGRDTLEVNGIPGATYQWYLGGVLDTSLHDSIAPHKRYTVVVSEENYVLVTTPSGCVASSDTIYILGTRPVISSAPLRLAPNPAHGKVQLLNATWPGPLFIYNNLGALIRTQEDWQQELDVSGLPAGVYHLRLGTQAGRMVVE